MTVHDLLVLAVEGAEGVPAEHIAAKLAVPIGILIFCGAVYLLLWSNYGAKKGALIYGTALFGFTTMLGVFWWFGAPGTPVATGLQNFPGQAADEYQAKWFVFEQGSERAEFFPATNNLDDFQPVAEFLGRGDVPQEELEDDPKYAATRGDASSVGQQMVSLFLRTEDGQPQIGGERRAAYQETAEQMLVDEVGADAAEDYRRASPFITAETPQVLLTRDQGTLLAGSDVTAYANYVSPDGESVRFAIDSEPVFGFKTADLLWFPSAVWTGVSLVLFALSLFLLDRIEQREKRETEEAEEPERLAVPIRQ